MNQDEQRERLRQQRRQAYLAAKERQRNDPKYIALKEKQRAQRREAYQQQKQKRADFIKAQKQAKNHDKAEQQKARDELLAQSLVRAKDLIPSNQPSSQEKQHPRAQEHFHDG